MKKLNYLLSAVVLMMVLMTVGCGPDDPTISPEDAVTEAFAKTWLLSSATLDGQAVTDLTGLTFAVTENMSYSTNSSTVARQPNPFPASGTWVFKSDITSADQSTFIITRDGNLDMDVTLSDTALTLGFTFDEAVHTGSGREEQVEGTWSVSFTAQ